MTTRSLLPSISEHDNYIWLLLAMLVVLFIGSVGQQMHNMLLDRLMGISMVLIVLVAVWSLERGRFPVLTRVGISLLFIAVESMETLFEKYDLSLLQLGTLLVFTITTIVICCRQALFTGSVDRNKIMGAICIYILLGIAWAQAYLIVEAIFPGSFPAFSDGYWRNNTAPALYFSYTTLTSVGFGDIVPTEPLTRHLAYMQAITGQLYLAIVVASLIGARMSIRREQQQHGTNDGYQPPPTAL